MAQEPGDSLVQYLKDHPRMIGVLFAAFVLLSKAGTAAAHGGGIGGP